MSPLIRRGIGRLSSEIFGQEAVLAEQRRRDLEALLHGIQFGGPASPPPSAAQPSTGSPSGAAVQFQTLLDSIPIANDGDLIFAEYHNSLRAAIGVIARNLDDSAFERIGILAFAPTLQPDMSQPQWRIGVGVAESPDRSAGGADEAHGWMPLQLPNASAIQSLTVRGERVGGTQTNHKSWSASLERQEVSGGTPELIASDATLHTKSGAFVMQIPVNPPNKTAAEVDAIRHVDTTRYRYLFRTEALGIDADLKVHGVEVTCARW